MTTHDGLHQYKTNELAFIAYRNEFGDGMWKKSELYQSVRDFWREKKGGKNGTKDGEKINERIDSQISAPAAPASPLEAPNTQTDPNSTITTVFNTLIEVTEEFKDYLGQSFITIDGEIFSFYGALYLKTIPNAFKIFVDPNRGSLQNAAAMFKE